MAEWLRQRIANSSFREGRIGSNPIVSAKHCSDINTYISHTEQPPRLARAYVLYLFSIFMISDPKSLEEFFSQYLPTFKKIIEDSWNDREYLVDFLTQALNTGIGDSWMRPYFEGILSRKVSRHEYTNPWEVL